MLMPQRLQAIPCPYPVIEIPHRGANNLVLGRCDFIICCPGGVVPGRVFGFRPVIGQLLPLMFGKATLEAESHRERVEYWKQQISSNNRVGSTRAAMGVIGREGVFEQLARINTPTLIIVGDQDVATPVVKSERMHEEITHSELKIIPGAGHSSCIEQPEAVARALSSFISSSVLTQRV